ncbi:MAG: excinuclease ABC subunit UvrC, partial [Clostridia bacterium]
MTEQNERLGYLRKKAINLPQSSGVYLMKNKQNKIIYVGKAKNLKNRLSSYFGSDKTLWLKVVAMVLQVFDFDYIMTDSEFEALVLENSLIKQNQPKYNILLKDDKGYSYIKVSKAPWARISESKKIEKDGSKYIGPYVSSWSVKSAIDEARKIFKLPSCNKVFPRDFGKSRPCLNFYIKQCNAPCLGKIKESDYAQNLEDALDFIKKGATESIKDLRRKMENAAENLEFEKAAFLRDKINAINKITETQKIVQSSIAFQDIIATATSEEKTAITVLKFRTGKLCDRQDYIFEKANLDEILQEFIQRYYENHEIPPRITLEKLLFDYEITEKWLSEKAEKKVAFFIPQKGEQLKLLEMCKSNAAEKLTDGTSKKGKDIVALEELSKLLGLKEIPRFIESYDISNTAGSENVAAMIVYKDGRP